MRICFLAKTNKTSVQNRERMKHFAKNHEVHVITNVSGTVEGVEKHKLPEMPNPIKYLIYPLIIRKILSNINPDLIHSAYITFYGFLASLTGFHPHIIFTRGGDVLRVPNWNIIYKFIVRFTLRTADYIVALSEHMIDDIENLGGKNIVKFPIGTYPKKFKPSEKKEDVVISTRMHKPVYNIELLLKSIPKVLEKINSLEVKILGKGPLTPHLKKLSKNLGISEKVKFTGYVENKNIPEYLGSAKIYVSTSLSDGCPASLFEAMSCGAFPVVTDIPANSDYINDGENGFLVPINDPDYLADKIVEALEKDKPRQKVVEKNRRLVKEKFDYEKILEDLEEFYKKVSE